MITTKLSAIPYGNAKIHIYNEDNIDLQSYETIVAVVRNGWLKVCGLYSATTRKHISAFVREYCGISYQVAKMLYKDGYLYNIHTGEVREVA